MNEVTNEELVKKLQDECLKLRIIVFSAEKVLKYINSDEVIRCKNCQKFLIEGGDNVITCVGCDKYLCISCSCEEAVGNSSDLEREAECINCYGDICLDCSNAKIGCKYCY